MDANWDKKFLVVCDLMADLNETFESIENKDKIRVTLLDLVNTLAQERYPGARINIAYVANAEYTSGYHLLWVNAEAKQCLEHVHELLLQKELSKG